MKIVIEIPDKKYEALKMLASATIGLHLGVVEKAIINGTPLPKGHGRLIDADKVEDITWQEPSYYDALNVLTEVRDRIRALPTIIEADKEADE